MSFNKSIFPFLVFGLLLQSCGNDAPVAKPPKAEVATQTASRELADAKVDAMIDTTTPSELETMEAKAEEAKAEKMAADEARAKKEKARKEKRAKARAEREKKAKEERRRKRREKRAAEKRAAEKRAKTTSNPVENGASTPAEYPSSTQTRNGAPIVSFYKTIHKYGTIEQGDKVEHKFRFVNSGNSELVVTDATASCGCTKPSYPFIPIEPGGEGYIGVIFDSKGKLGRQKPSVVITTNADPASYTVYLEGYVDSADEVEEVNKDENDKKDEDGKSF